jgi:malyl-CoA/(S)-citramalyl-CoA lyase
VLCGNLEDAIRGPEGQGCGAAGFIEVRHGQRLGDTGLWVRVNALNSPWFLDDVAQIVAAAAQSWM